MPPDERKGPAWLRRTSPKSNRRQGHRCAQYDPPSTFGLSDRELWTEIFRLVNEHGWTFIEIQQVFLIPTEVDA